MAVLQILPISETQSNENGVLCCTLEWLLRLDPYATGNALTAKAYCSALPNPLDMWLQTITARQVNRSQEWFEVTAKYAVPNLPNANQDPTTRPSMLTATYEEFSEDYFVDNSPTPLKVINSAGDRFDSFPQRRNAHLVLQISKGLALDSTPLLYLDSIKFTTNASSQSIRGVTYPAGTLLFLPAAVEERVEQVQGTLYDYFAVTYRLATDSNLHQDIVMDRGFRILGTDGNPIPVTQGGVVPTTPLFLDGSGHLLAPADPPVPIAFTPYPSVTWGIDFT